MMKNKKVYYDKIQVKCGYNVVCLSYLSLSNLTRQYINTLSKKRYEWSAKRKVPGSIPDKETRFLMPLKQR